MVEQQTQGFAVRRSVVVETSPERAFFVFTQGMTSWWPIDSHSIGDRPMAEAVIIAMLASFILSRTLVPTMAKYLMKSHHAAAA